VSPSKNRKGWRALLVALLAERDKQMRPRQLVGPKVPVDASVMMNLRILRAE